MLLRINILKKNVEKWIIQLRRHNQSDNDISMQKAMGLLRFNLRMRYEEKKVDSYFLNDFAYRVISQYPALKNYFEEYLEKNKDFEEMKRWELLNFDVERYPIYFPFEDNPDDDLYAEKSDYLSLPKNITVKVCLSNDEIMEAITAIKCANESGFNVVGFDCEWPPFFNSDHVSIIQIALNNQCFLIDASYGNKDVIGTFLNELFSGQNLFILGRSSMDDVSKLLSTYPHIKALHEPKNILCLTKLIRKFNSANSCKNNGSGNIDYILPDWKMYFSEFGHERFLNDYDIKNLDTSIDCDEMIKDGELVEDKKVERTNKEKQELIKDFNYVIERAGLSRISKMILGKELDKIEQLSVWDRRPLRISQIRYAALDAEVSRMVYLKLEEWGNDLNIDVRKLVIECTSKKAKKKS